MILEFDKKGAEWVVVAYLSQDPRMIDIIESGKKPHLETGHSITQVPKDLIEKEQNLVGHSTDPDTIRKGRDSIILKEGTVKGWETLTKDGWKSYKYLPRNMTIYQMGKKANHGLNYRQSHIGFSEAHEMTQTEAKPIVDAYSQDIYTKLPDWWSSIEEELRTQKRVLYNCAPFRRKRYFMDQWGSHMIREAIAYKPQSTVADITLSAMRQIYQDNSPLMWHVDFLGQVHDSIVLQYPTDDIPRLAAACIKICEYLEPSLITEQGRQFNISTELKIGPDWSHESMREVTLDPDKLEDNLREAING